MSTLQSDLQKTASPAPAAKPRYKGKSGAQIFHEMLIQQHKVEVMFGYPGGAILPVFDELYR
ncbi:MAG: acetolactate synthase large subunit, partial [Phycisphaerales bacterium]|nr:acetolactate synthase large subunit [Phycisphaerales bacterium]